MPTRPRRLSIREPSIGIPTSASIGSISTTVKTTYSAFWVMSPTSGNRTADQLVAATFTGATSPIYTNPTDTLTQLLVTGEYYRDRHYGGLVSFTRTTGTSDPLANGGNGSPANQYETFELDYIPWLNVRFHPPVRGLVRWWPTTRAPSI